MGFKRGCLSEAKELTKSISIDILHAFLHVADDCVRSEGASVNLDVV